jgi:hypothetical protein
MGECHIEGRANIVAVDSQHGTNIELHHGCEYKTDRGSLREKESLEDREEADGICIRNRITGETRLP